jgi:hypothetical protein
MHVVLNCGIFADWGLASNNPAKEQQTLIDLLTEVRDLQSSKFQDCLYAIMHLDDPFREGEIEAGDTRKPSQVMLDVAKYHVNKYYNLRFLHESIRHIPDQN